MSQATKKKSALPGQVVLVLQGGGALGAYQAGVYQALHDAGIEPDWVIGTSIGAINAALIAGNAPARRPERLRAFWHHVEQHGAGGALPWFGVGRAWDNLATLWRGIPSMFAPNAAALAGPHAPVGIEAASWYDTSPLRGMLAGSVDFTRLGEHGTRLTVGAVHANTGEMRYFDSQTQALRVDHVMASAALPPAFPAVRIDGEPYWDGGIYSNTPLEAVLDDVPRRDSVIFAVNVWHPQGPEPATLWQVMGRQKDIQYASRSDSHVRRQQQLHRLRHVIRELCARMPPSERRSEDVRELAAWGCGTTMHIVQLVAPRLAADDPTKDIDFSSGGIRRRWQAGRDDTLQMIERRPWTAPVDPIEGVVVHTLDALG
jgi:NTE family protein